MTPMMEQYLKIKNEYKDHILFYRLGDFYEMFFDDAITASRVLDLTLTGRDCGEEERAPMCGVPYHAAETYIGRLIKAGYKVAICEQLEDPKATKGLVKRGITRVITKGTTVEPSLLNESLNNFLCSICFSSDSAALAFTDVTSATLYTTLVEGKDLSDKIINELSAFFPTEIITNEPIDKYPRIKQFTSMRLGTIVYTEPPERYDYGPCTNAVITQFGEEEGRTVLSKPMLVRAAGSIVSYLRDVFRSNLPTVRELKVYSDRQYLEMDANSRRSLELCEAMRTGEKRGSLLWVLDKTKSAAGARLLRRFIEQPLTDIAEITRRQRAVGELCDSFLIRSDIEELLASVLDLERLITRVVCKTANARDLAAICATLKVIPRIKELLEGSECSELKRIYENLDALPKLVELLESTLSDEELPVSVREGGMIRSGYHEELDRLRETVTDGKGWLKRIAEEEREKTGIRTLKIGYNRVFGYYIEVSKSFMDQVPDTYIRKQTLANAERYVTEELKKKEAEVLGANDKICALEYDIFCYLCSYVLDNAPAIRRIASLLSLLDVYCSLATVASQNRYVCPSIEADEIIDIKGGRHPVVEKFLSGELFVPNDTYLDTNTHRTMLITGPNMAGKSTYMRQTALIVLMAQIGSFVPADSARIGIVDKIFTRIGASDDLAGGQSTFMLEMNEVAYILKNATKKSLIIYDEVGRGTSTYDGMSVARAVVEYTNGKKLGARTMFATHYHELTCLENEYEGIVNYNIAAKKRGDDILFLRKIVRGSTDDSFGIEVAKLAGVPSEVISRARSVLSSLESGSEVSQGRGQVHSITMIKS